MFAANGYSNVSVAEVARAVNVVPSAIFRHFPTKADLLVAAFLAELEPFESILTEHEDWTLSPLVERLAACALDHRNLGVLWQREARNLAPEVQEKLRKPLRAATRRLAVAIAAERPALPAHHIDLLAWCSMGALVSTGFHTLNLPEDRYRPLLVELTLAIAGVQLGVAPSSEASDVRPSASVTPTRDTLLSEATELFAEFGFGAVPVDRIAEAAGIAGPSIYSHFDSKQEILREAVTRGTEQLRADAEVAFSEESDMRRRLARLVHSFVERGVANRFLMRVALSEQRELEQDAREFARAEQREYIGLWAGLLADPHGDADDWTEARIRVQTVLLVVNDAVQTPHLRAQPGFAGDLESIANSMLTPSHLD